MFFAPHNPHPRITPNGAEPARHRNVEQHGAFLRSLRRISREVNEDARVYSGHRMPFLGLQERCDALARHHQDRCSLIMDAAHVQARSVAELVPVLFHKRLSPHEMSFAFSEAFAHVNFLVHNGDLRWIDTGNGSRKVVPTH